MNRNTMYSGLAVFLVLLGGVGLYVGYKGYKKYKAKQNQEIRYQVAVGKVQDGFNKEAFKNALLSDEMLEHVIEKNDLLAAWGMTDVEAAKSRIREKFHVTVEAMEVRVSYQDKDKDLAKRVLQTILDRMKSSASAPPAARP